MLSVINVLKPSFWILWQRLFTERDTKWTVSWCQSGTKVISYGQALLLKYDAVKLYFTCHTYYKYYCCTHSCFFVFFSQGLVEKTDWAHNYRLVFQRVCDLKFMFQIFTNCTRLHDPLPFWSCAFIIKGNVHLFKEKGYYIWQPVYPAAIGSEAEPEPIRSSASLLGTTASFCIEWTLMLEKHSLLYVHAIV